MKLIAGQANKPLAEAIARYLRVDLGECKITKFADEEIFIEIGDNVRGEDVFIIQPTNRPANHNLMELLIMIDALRRGSARRITAVVPYYGYARQDRKTGSRTPITAKLIANMMQSAGANRVITLDLHAAQIQGFFEIPVDNLYARPVLVNDISKTCEDINNLMIISPDVGGVARARSYANKLSNSPLAIIDKRRDKPNESEVMNVIGDVSGKDCILVDDIVDTAGTLCNAAAALMEKGAKTVRAYISHGVLSPPAIDRLENSAITELVITDSIQLPEAYRNKKIVRTVSIAWLLGESIRRVSNEESISVLFNDTGDDSFFV